MLKERAELQRQLLKEKAAKRTEMSKRESTRAMLEDLETQLEDAEYKAAERKRSAVGQG